MSNTVTTTDLWSKRIDQLYEETIKHTGAITTEQGFREGFFAGMEEAKRMFASASFSKKTRQVIRTGKEWRFK